MKLHGSRTREPRRLLPALATLLVLALTAAAPAAAGGPGEAAAGGCALQCIEKALVTSTTSSAKVELVTSVPTTIKVTARKLPTPYVGPVDASAKSLSPNTKRALFLDRDGTLIVDTGYPNNPDAVQLVPNAAWALRYLQQYVSLVIVTNQSGLSRGIINPAQMLAEEAVRRVRE